ncbi:MAG TPA: DapH/DapD/GlmU-related protein [Labilithrix sp.]|nr:DapH/DapD/GlmU-related protein [Labilithrix sp.]
MTWMGALVTFFPAYVVLLALGAIVWFAMRPGLLPLVTLLSSLYVFPLVAYRLHALAFPLSEGGSFLVGGDYSAWYGGHRIQVIYIAIPALEALLRTVPGLYSAWLRLWGSKIGRDVYWTPQVDIADRGLVEIGDGVLFGHRAGVISHVIKPSRENLFLYVKKVKIGDGAFIGAGSYIGPGVVVEARAMVPVATNVYPKQRIKR